MLDVGTILVQNSDGCDIIREEELTCNLNICRGRQPQFKDKCCTSLLSGTDISETTCPLIEVKSSVDDLIAFPEWTVFVTTRVVDYNINCRYQTSKVTIHGPVKFEIMGNCRIIFAGRELRAGEIIIPLWQQNPSSLPKPPSQHLDDNDVEKPILFQEEVYFIISITTAVLSLIVSTVAICCSCTPKRKKQCRRCQKNRQRVEFQIPFENDFPLTNRPPRNSSSSDSA